MANGLWARKSGSREIITRNEKAIERIQVRHDGGFGQGSYVGGGGYGWVLTIV